LKLTNHIVVQHLHCFIHCQCSATYWTRYRTLFVSSSAGTFTKYICTNTTARHLSKMQIYSWNAKNVKKAISRLLIYCTAAGTRSRATNLLILLFYLCLRERMLIIECLLLINTRKNHFLTIILNILMYVFQYIVVEFNLKTVCSSVVWRIAMLIADWMLTTVPFVPDVRVCERGDDILSTAMPS